MTKYKFIILIKNKKIKIKKQWYPKKGDKPKMHIQASILQQEEERQVKILEANYTKVDINAIVEKLVVKRDTKQKFAKR